MGKKLSIITINYNNKEGLALTLESIFKQNEKLDEIESIVIDGGSDDGSIQIIGEYAENIDYWTSEPDGGIFCAMNKGLSKASGEFINFMNSGDCFVKGILTKSFFEKLKGDICYGDIILKNGSKIKYLKQESYPDFFYLFGRTICHQSIFMRTTLCRKYPFQEDYSIMGDWIQLFSIMKAEQPKILYWPKAVCIYDEDGLSNRHAELRKLQRESFLLEHYTAWELGQIAQLARLRGRPYFKWVLGCLDIWRRHIILKWISKLI